MSLAQRMINAVRSGYRRAFRRQESDRTREAVEALRQVSLFRDFSRSALVDLAEVMHRRRYRRDEFIYYENDPGLGLYIIRRGRVRLLAEDDNGTVHELRQVEDHTFFGEISLLGDFRRMETAQALVDTDVLGFFSPDLQTLLKRNPTVGAEVVMALARHLVSQQHALMERLTQSEGKVAALRLRPMPSAPVA